MNEEWQARTTFIPLAARLEIFEKIGVTAKR